MATPNIYVVAVAHHDQAKLPEWMVPAKEAVVVADDLDMAVRLCGHMVHKSDMDLLTVEKIGKAVKGMQTRLVVKHEDSPRCEW